MNHAQDSRLRPVIAISLLTAACLIGDSMLYVVLPTHWQEAKLSSLWEVGILLSANRLIRLPLNPLVGWLYQHISSRNGVLFASLLAVLTTASYGMLQGFWLLLAMRCLWGMAWTFLRLGAYFTILDCCDNDNRGHYMGTYNGLFRLGSLIGMLAGGLLADLLGLKSTALLFSALTACSIPFIYLYIPKSQSPRPSQSKVDVPPNRNSRLWTKGPIIWALVTGTIIAMIYQGMFNATLSHLIQFQYTDTVPMGGIVIGAASLAGILQAIRWGWEPWLAPWFGKLSDGSCGRRPLLYKTLLASALLFAVIPIQLPLLPWLLLLLLLQITATILTTISDALASDAAATASKSVMTAYSFATDLGAALGPMAAYLLSQFLGTIYTYWSAALLLVLLAVKWIAFPPDKTVNRQCN